jgi:fimbrial chaperone protein
VLRKITCAVQITALMLCCTAPIQEAFASSFIVSPVTFDLTTKKPMSILRLSNNGDANLRLQVHAVKWDTDGHNETKVDTDEVIVNPPVFTIKPGQQQFLRFGLRSVTQTEKEQSYRLVLREVPDDTPIGPHGGLRTVLEVSIPVFIDPAKKNEQVAWHLVKKGNQYSLVADNGGNVHLKITGFVALDSSGAQVIADNNLSYIMPGQRKEWPITAKSDLGKITLKVITAEGPHEETLDAEVQ